MEKAVKGALKDAASLKIHGQDVTPFLLRRVSEITGKDSLEANLGLLKNNARVAAQVAVQLSNT
jgi:pseudouridine-5'-phosphate glycosidase